MTAPQDAPVAAPLDLRARILEVLVTTPIAEVAADPEAAGRRIGEPWWRHDEHRYHGRCALCRGEAGTLADAVMVVLAEVAPGLVEAVAADA